jgi:hypothetical protein
MKRIKWSDAEKATLKELYDRYGEFCFVHVPKFIPWRETKDARQVWKYHLKPDVKRTIFTVKEQEKIKNLREEGIGWSEMEKHLNGRDQIRLRNEYRKIKKQEKLERSAHQAKIKEYQEEKKEEKEEEKEEKKMQTIETKHLD